LGEPYFKREGDVIVGEKKKKIKQMDKKKRQVYQIIRLEFSITSWIHP